MFSVTVMAALAVEGYHQRIQNNLPFRNGGKLARSQSATRT